MKAKCDTSVLFIMRKLRVICLLLQTLKAIIKKSLFYVPGLGMIFYANEYIFLDRKWAADEPRMTAMVKQSQEFPYPVSVSS